MKSPYKCREGECLNRNPNNPVIEVTGNGPRTFLWIGNAAKGDCFCFATLSGRQTLLRLAREIRRAVAGGRWKKGASK